MCVPAYMRMCVPAYMRMCVRAYGQACKIICKYACVHMGLWFRVNRFKNRITLAHPRNKIDCNN